MNSICAPPSCQALCKGSYSHHANDSPWKLSTAGDAALSYIYLARAEAVLGGPMSS